MGRIIGRVTSWEGREGGAGSESKGVGVGEGGVQGDVGLEGGVEVAGPGQHTQVVQGDVSLRPRPSTRPHRQHQWQRHVLQVLGPHGDAHRHPAQPAPTRHFVELRGVRAARQVLEGEHRYL